MLTVYPMHRRNNLSPNHRRANGFNSAQQTFVPLCFTWSGHATSKPMEKGGFGSKAAVDQQCAGRSHEETFTRVVPG
jgi:hypothetical protein